MLFHLRLLVLTLALLTHHCIAQEVWQSVDRVVAVGDLHGDYEQYIETLERNGLIDHALRWSGGETHLVQLGDVPDRGPDSLEIMRHLMKLERQARRAGGRVHVLIGNHEAMNVEGDLRYVHPGEYEALTSRRSERLRDQYVERVGDWLEENAPEADRSLEALNARYPVGFVEHRQLWAPDGEIGRWVLDHHTVIRIDRVLFVHGGLNPHDELLPLEEINGRIREALAASAVQPAENHANREDGPLWYRGLATEPAETELPPLERMLDYYDAERIVIAHTPTEGRVKSRFGGRVILVDVGLSAHYGGHDANLVIEEGELFEQTADGRVVLAMD